MARDRHLLQPRTHRRGLTIIELVAVIAIIGTLSAIGIWSSRSLIDDWRTRSAARTFANAVQLCKATAVNSGAECRIRLDAFDSAPVTPGVNAGRFFIEVGNSPQNSDAWEMMPPDAFDDGTDDDQSQGTYDLADANGDFYHHDVSIGDWSASGVINGPYAGNGDCLVFNPRGFLVNPTSDFQATGSIDVVFINKDALQKGEIKNYVVKISQSGMVRIDTNDNRLFGSVTSGVTEDVIFE
ncbi:MAG: GspH/FimT family pseudopilin [Myxococcota bacterium]